MPPGLSVTLWSVEPALVWAGVFLGMLVLIPAPAIRAAACGLAVGCFSGPALELPGAWLPLVAAAALAPGPRKAGVVPALVGLVMALTWGMDPALWPLAGVLAALSAGAAAPEDHSPSSVLVLIGLVGGVKAWVVDGTVDGVRFDEVPEQVERHGAAWAAPRVVERLEEGGWFTEETSVRDRARMVAELGGGRVAFRVLGLEPLPTWERAALLNQVGRTAPALFLGLLEPPDGAAEGPGVVFARDAWVDGGGEVVPLVLAAPATELVVSSRGEFLLGEPELEVQISGQTLGPIAVPDEGGTWTLPVDLGRGVHRMTVRFHNPHSNKHTTRALYDLEISLR